MVYQADEGSIAARTIRGAFTPRKWKEIMTGPDLGLPLAGPAGVWHPDHRGAPGLWWLAASAFC
jgi:hypothetical protein